jgi:hypothetical protein
MSRKPLPDDAVYGNATKIAALDPPIPRATLIRLQQEGKLPVTRFAGTWFTNSVALRRAKEAARKRGEEWAQPREMTEECA